MTLYRNKASIVRSGEFSEIDHLIDRETGPAYLIEVLDELNNPLMFITRTQKSLLGAKANQRHILRPRARQCLDVEVTRENVHRAMRIMDALAKALEQRGYAISIDDEKGQTQVSVLGETLGIHLEEQIRRVSHVLTPDEEKKKARDSYYRFQIPEFDYLPTGKLSLSIRGRYLCSVRSSWSDAKIQRLENCLNNIIADVIKAAFFVKTRRLEYERKEREWADERRRREELCIMREHEQAKLDQLHQQTRNWVMAQQIRSFVEVVRVSDSHKVEEICQGMEVTEWDIWASRQADRLDPLAVSIECILDDKPD